MNEVIRLILRKLKGGESEKRTWKVRGIGRTVKFVIFGTVVFVTET